MSRLYLLRHAKARWAEPGRRDFDRKLEDSGKADAFSTAAAMAINGWFPQATLCSTAARTRETLQEASAPLGIRAESVTFLDSLYSADAAGYLAIIREHGAAGSLLLIGHNPMIEDLALALSGSGDADNLAALASGFSTAGLAVLEFDGPLSSIEPGAGRLEAFIVPAR